VRITFDRNIRAGMGIMDIFNPQLPLIETLPGNKLVMEVKYREFLPRVLRKMLPTKASEHAAVSKYILACDRTLFRKRSDF
jgi:hypothetical protein